MIAGQNIDEYLEILITFEVERFKTDEPTATEIAMRECPTIREALTEREGK